MNIPLSTCARVLLLGSFLTGTTAFGTVVYDNTVNYLNLSYSAGNGVEFGDEIFLAGGPGQTITQFEFDTFVGANANGNESVTIRFLLNDGTPLGPNRVQPSTSLYTSSSISLPLGFATTTLSSLAVTLPAGVNNFTWTAEFNGIDAGEQVGLLFYHPPVIGDSYTDIWKKQGSTWDTFLFNGINASFGARIQTPEAGSSAALFSLALAPLLCGSRRWLRSLRA
ncbi:MAG: hypothetical protein U1G07_12665 [Verrucomicrobiota bacterium]